MSLSRAVEPLLGEDFWACDLEMVHLTKEIDEPLTREETERLLYSDISAEITESRLTGSDVVVYDEKYTAVAAETGETQEYAIRYIVYSAEHIVSEQRSEETYSRFERTPGSAHITTAFNDPYLSSSLTVNIKTVDGGFHTTSREVSENTVLGLTETTVTTTLETGTDFSMEGQYLSEYDDGTRMELIMAMSGTDEYHADGTIDISMNQKLPVTEDDEIFLDLDMGCAISAAAIESVEDRIAGAKVTTSPPRRISPIPAG